MEDYTKIVMQQRETILTVYELLKKIKKLIKAVDKLTAGNQPVQILLDVINQEITDLLEG